MFVMVSYGRRSEKMVSSQSLRIREHFTIGSKRLTYGSSCERNKRRYNIEQTEIVCAENTLSHTTALNDGPFVSWL